MVCGSMDKMDKKAEGHCGGSKKRNGPSICSEQSDFAQLQLFSVATPHKDALLKSKHTHSAGQSGKETVPHNNGVQNE